ncbi:hypothetical protein B0H13DRAFT_1673295, partial [Mycena leptocephala]
MSSDPNQALARTGSRSYRRYTPLDANPAIPTIPVNADAYRLDPSVHSSAPTQPSSTLPDFPHTQPRLRRQKQTAEEKTLDKFAAMEEFLKSSPFDTLGDFLAILFYNKPRNETDPRGMTHANAVAQFLRGRTEIKMSHILPLMYHHKASFPHSKCVDVHEQKEMFATSGPVNQSNHARPFMSTWATRLVALEARKQVGRATKDDPNDPDTQTRFRAHSNDRTNAKVISWPELLSHFNLKWIESKYCIRLPLPMFLTQHMAAPSSKGVFFVRKRRPHPIIQVGAIASFIISRNRYANADLAMALGVWHFACKSHIDVKRVYCRFGYSVSDTTARHALNSMTTASLAELRDKIKDATERGQTEGCLLLDNVQQYCDVHEQGIGRQSQLKVGTAGTWVELEDCAPGAFDAEPYYAKVAEQERKDLTTDDLFDSINWPHMRIHNMFRDGPLAIHRMRDGRKAKCQPLSTNSERSTETQGMRQAVKDFDGQTGIDSDAPGNLLSWIRGDGASYANLLNLCNYSAPLGTFKNKIATPEIWHTGATDLTADVRNSLETSQNRKFSIRALGTDIGCNSTASNHYGPATSSDPSSLSKCSHIVGFKRPSNVKSCDYYPTVRNLKLIWTAHVLDCWRIFFETDDLDAYFRNLAETNELPDLSTLLGYAMVLVDRYATQSAIRASLSESESTAADRSNKVPVGSEWVAPTTTIPPTHDAQDPDLPDLVDIIEGETTQKPPVPAKTPEDAPKVHQEKDGFTGDRVLRNSQIFMQDFGWWIEFAHAVPEGDIGRVWEIMKV